MRESAKARRERASEILDRLAWEFPDARCALDFTNPFELLVATVLSAQTTDARVNSVTPELFATYPSPVELAGASQDDLERILHPLGFFRAKARSLRGLAAGLLERYDGEVPASLEALVTLPGVGRKTANVVLGNAVGIPGITVDTHVGRLSRRLGFTKNEDPVKVEKDLWKVIPEPDWTVACHRLILHGRATCHSRKPNCGACVLADLCPSALPDPVSTQRGTRS